MHGALMMTNRQQLQKASSPGSIPDFPHGIFHYYTTPWFGRFRSVFQGGVRGGGPFLFLFGVSQDDL